MELKFCICIATKQKSILYTISGIHSNQKYLCRIMMNKRCLVCYTVACVAMGHVFTDNKKSTKNQ